MKPTAIFNVAMLSAAVQASIPGHIVKAGGEAMKWVARNPGSTAVAGLSMVAVVAPAVVSAPVLAAAGFGTKGVVATSVATTVQSGIGNVVAPSVFATLQSAGAGGAGAATVNAFVQLGGAGVAVGAGGLAWLKRKLK